MDRLLARAREIAHGLSQHVCKHADDADDALQEALLKVYRYASRIRKPDDFRVWLYRTVKNACLMERRRRAGEPIHLLTLEEAVLAFDDDWNLREPIDRGQSPDEIVATAALRGRLKESLAALPRSYRLVVFLREIEGLSTREAAKVMQISETNAKVRLHRAHALLRAHLVGNGRAC